MFVVAATVFVGCSTIADNVTVDIDGIIASTCATFADQLTRQIEIQLTQLTDENDIPLPDVDIEQAIDRAQELGCSPDDMRSLIEGNLETVIAESDKARAALEELREQAQTP